MRGIKGTTPTCSVPSCDLLMHARGVCSTHYMRLLHHGSLIDRRYERTEAERFWEKVSTPTPDGCWLWTGGTSIDGYGTFGLTKSKKTVRSHRWAYEALVGAIPEGLTLDHLCRNTLCVNPAHLEPVTSVVNVQRGKALITHCPHGHPYDSENTYHWRGHRICKACQRIRRSR